MAYFATTTAKKKKAPYGITLPKVGLNAALNATKAGATSWGNFTQSLGTPGGMQQNNPYAGLIGSQPDLSALEATFGAQSTEDAASRDAALRRLIISYGGSPDFGSMGISDKARGFLNSALDPKTRELAAKAEAEGLSVHARQASENAIANRRIPALLAGRGLLRSGQTGYDLGQQAQGYKTQQFDTLNELLSGVEGTVGSFLQAERQRQLELAQARMQAAWDAYSNWGDYQVAPAPAAPGSPAATRPATPARRAPATPKIVSATVSKAKKGSGGVVNFRNPGWIDRGYGL